MTPLKLGIVAVFFTAAIAIPMVAGRQAQARLREENDSLRTQLGQMSALKQANEQLSNQVVQANSAQAEMAKKLKDLPRLRGEASSLRRQTNDVAKLLLENRKLQAAAAARKSPLEGITPLAQFDLSKEPGPFVGYATPEAAMQSMMWAHHNFDLKAILDSVTPEERSDMEKRLRQGGPEAERQFREKMTKEFAQMKRISILDKQVLSENQILFHIYIEGPEQKLAARFRKIKGEWKFDNFDGN